MNVPEAKKSLQHLVDLIHTYKFSPYEVTRFDELNSYLYANEKPGFGIRQALGANRASILSLVLAQGLRTAGVGMALGLGAAFAATRLMKRLLFGVSPSDPVVFVAISLLLGGVGLFACWLPARRAAALDPVKALRYE